jgi:predicted HAD superfamily Cof-like phosphohydrolase
MNIHHNKVKKFMQLAGQALPNCPTVPNEEVRRLRANLIIEEAIETVRALGFDIVVDNEFCENSIKLELTESGPDLIDIIDGVADLTVVSTGTALACGIDPEPFQEEVDENNLAKFGPGHKIRKDGKLVKPPDFKGPNIELLLEQFSHKEEVPECAWEECAAGIIFEPIPVCDAALAARDKGVSNEV